MSPEEEIEKILKEEDMPLTQEILALNRKMRAETAVKRNELRELYDKFEAMMNALLDKRTVIREKILRIWKAHFDNQVTLDLPTAMVSRRNKPEMEIHDTTALLNALDITNRLDLVSYQFSDREIVKLLLQGKLEELPPEAVTIEDNYDLQVRPKEKKHAWKKTTDG